MIGIHEKLKYGDIVYIEFFNQFKKSRIVITSSGFVLRHKSYVETKKIVLTGDSIYLKDFEDNLFVLFPIMNDDFLTHKTILDEILKQIKPKVEISQNVSDDASIKKDINKIITTFQETKKDVYSENEKFLKQIGTPIKFGDNFILIHFKSQMFVTKHDFDSLTNQNKNKLILSDYYTDDCIFLFSPYNNYDNKADYVFSNQNLFIRKKEKNMWANNQYLKMKAITEEDMKTTVFQNLRNSGESGTILGQKNEKYILTFTEDQNNANPFQIKICSNYIDPSSSNLSFANPVWICCQNVDKYLIITPNNKDDGILNEIGIVQGNDDRDSIIGHKNTIKSNCSYGNNNKVFRNSTLTNYTISFASIDREKTMNNIYGLFNVEQIENQKSLNYNDQYLKEQLMNNIELRVSPRIEYNKKIRFRHIATRKYLGFEEKVVDMLGKTKSAGSLILEDIPNEKCDWTFMESYKIIDREKYERAKEEGIKAPSKEAYLTTEKKGESILEGNDAKSHTVKKKEILRVFHLKSQKFLSFEELTSKVVSEFDERMLVVRNLSLNKSANDSDLVRLLPSNENQSWEIHLILYFNSVLCKQIVNVVKTDIYKYIFGDPSNNPIKLEPIPEDEINTDKNEIDQSQNQQEKKDNPAVFTLPGVTVNNNPSKTKFDGLFDKETYEKELKLIKVNTTELRICFENLRDFCLNKFERKFDTSATPGKPVFYRQEFLSDQNFLDKTFVFLSNTTKFSEIYQQYVKIAEQNIQTSGGNKQKETTTPMPPLNPPTTLGNTSPMLERSNSTKKKRNLNKKANSNLASIGEIFKQITLCITRAFEFLSAMCKNHPKNTEYVFKHREIFWNYLLEYKEASDCLINIIQDDENYMNEIIQEAMDNKEDEDSSKNIIGMIINYLNNNDKYDIHILNLLSKMMKSKNKGITSSQEYIYKSLFEAKKDKFLLKISPQYNDTVFHVVYRNEAKEFVSRNLIELCLTKNVLNEYDKNIVRYLAEELNLYADLCYGRNYVCIEKVRSLFPLDHLIYHISNIELHEEILSGLINILNFVYIDIEPHAETIYPSMIKIVTDDLKIEKINKISIKTYIPLDKLHLILCLSLYLLHNIKYGKILVNTANINLIYNIIQFRLYENVEYKAENIKEVINTQLDRSIHNLKEEVKNFIIIGEKIIKENMQHQFGDKGNKKEKLDEKGELSKVSKQSFFDKIGYKFVEFDFDHEIGSEYLIFVLDHINEFFLERVIVDNIDANMENKNIIAQTFKTVNKTDMLTQNNINYLIKILMEIKAILNCGNEKKIYTSNNDLTDKQKVFLPIIKQIANVIDFILNIKKEDMINKILENLMKENKTVILNVLSRVKEKKKEKEKKYLGSIKKKKVANEGEEDEDIVHLRKESIYEICEEEFSKGVNFKETMMENEYYLYQLFNELSTEEVNGKIQSETLFESKQNEISNNERNSLINRINDENNNIEGAKVNYRQKIFFMNYESEYLNSIAFKTLHELIIRILEVNIDERLTKILVRLFTRIHTQRKEIVECIKNIRMLYGEKDLKKYIQCRALIKKLSMLTEKTEIWMSDDKLPMDKLVTKDTAGFKATFEIALSPKGEMPSESEENFESVIMDLNMLIRMCYRRNTQNMYKKPEKLKLMQTIFFSFKLHDVLFSLIREITQVYPVSVREDDVKQRYFQKSLQILLKQIFKLFRNMIHNAPEFMDNIKDTISYCKSYEYLNDLGFLDLITAIIPKNENFLTENIKFIIDLIVKNFKFSTFSNVFRFFAVEDFDRINVEDEVIIEDANPNSNAVPKMTKREYEKEIKRCCQVLSLIKAILTKVKETKYLNLIINNFEEIMKQFMLFSSASQTKKKIYESRKLNEKEIYKESPTMQIIKITSKASNYKMKMLYYLTKIGYSLIRLNEKLKGLILKIFPLSNLRENILKLDFPLTAENIEKILDLTTRTEREKIKKDHCVESQLKSFYKLKYTGFTLFSLINSDLQRTKDLKSNMEIYFSILENDANKYFELTKMLKGYYENEPKSYVIKIMKKAAYHYFFKGVFGVIFQLTSVFKRDVFKSETEYQNAISKYKKVMKKWKSIFCEMINEKENYEFYTKTLTYVNFKKQNFTDYFDKFKIKVSMNESSESKVDRVYMEYKTHLSKKAKNKNEFALITKTKKTLKKQLAISFTEDFISRIENNKKITKYINKEIKIVAQNLKSKINFHQVMQLYINENSPNTIVDEILLEQDNNHHLLNVFLKFIQENYLSMKYYPEIVFLIELFAYFIEVKPLFLKPMNKENNVLQSNFYVSSRISELEDNFLVHCQKIFLNNGSAEVFLKIVCEGNKKFNFFIFPSVLHFFNNVLEGGNTLSQAKFYQLFIFFPNSDNFFFYIKQMFDYDIYQNLQIDISLKEPKIDFDNLNTMTNLLKFLQLLTENHFTNLQSYLRDQASNRLSYNFIIILVDYMNMLLGKLGNIHETNQVLTKYATELYYKRLIAVLETLCEFLQGPCKLNQETIINSKIIEIFDKILRETEIVEVSYAGEEAKKDGMEESNEGVSGKSTVNDFGEENENEEGDNNSILEQFDNESENIENSTEEKSKMKTFSNKSGFVQVSKLFYLLSDYEKSLLIYKIGLVLLAIIEGRKTKDEVIKKILRDFDYKLIYDKVNEMYLKLRNQMEFFLYGQEVEEFDEVGNRKVVAEAGFNLYFFLVILYTIENDETEFKKMSNLLLKEQHKLSKIEKENLQEISHNFASIQNAMLFFKENSLNIEIVKDEEVLRVFCPKLPFFKNLTKDILKEFQTEANRTSIQTKLNALLNQKDEYYQTMLQLYKLELVFKKTGPLQYLFTYPKVIQIICLILTFVMNVFILIGYNVENDKDQKDVLKNVILFGTTEESKFIL